MAVDERFEVCFLTHQGTLPWQIILGQIQAQSTQLGSRDIR